MNQTSEVIFTINKMKLNFAIIGELNSFFSLFNGYFLSTKLLCVLRCDFQPLDLRSAIQITYIIIISINSI